jgi:hypothetical protein
MSETIKHTVVEREIGGRTMKFETGKVAKLASGAVVACAPPCAPTRARASTSSR